MKNVKAILLIVLFWIFGIVCNFAQGPPNGWPPGNGNGNPPPPPNAPCPPVCDGNISTPIDGGVEYLVVVGLVLATFMLLNKKGVTNDA